MKENIPNTTHKIVRLVRATKNSETKKAMKMKIFKTLLRFTNSITNKDEMDIKPQKIPNSFHPPIKFEVGLVDMLAIKLMPGINLNIWKMATTKKETKKVANK